MMINEYRIGKNMEGIGHYPSIWLEELRKTTKV